MKINDDEDALPLEHSGTESTGPQCPISNPPDYFRITTVNLAVKNPVSNYKEAMQLANTEAENRLGQFMLLSWYDKDRDFESRSIQANVIRIVQFPAMLIMG